MLGGHEKKPRSRDPERTRERLLQAAFRKVYRSGFQSAGVEILGAANVTKGALYYHFDSKEDLGYAIVEEIIAKFTHEKWLVPLERGKNPIDTLIGIVQRTSVRPRRCKGRLSPPQFGAGDVSSARTIPQAIGEDLQPLARRDCHGSAKRTVSKEPPSAATCPQKTLLAFSSRCTRATRC